jgi:arsenate reductase (thioredoxin)
MGKIKVLFLCTGNSARSQMAEAFLKHYGGDLFEVHSAGLIPYGIHPNTRKVMAELGFNLEGHYSKSVSEYLGIENFHYLITVCAYAEKNCPTTFLGFSQRLHWQFEDPSGFQGSEEIRLDKYREIRDQIEKQVQSWLIEQSFADLFFLLPSKPNNK